MRFSIITLIFFAACGGCTDDAGQTLPDAGVDTDTDTGVELNGVGEPCSTNSQCQSTACEAGQCVATPSGPRCGTVYCGAADECLTGDVCGIDELPTCAAGTELVGTECVAICMGEETYCAAVDTCCAPDDACLFDKCVPLGDACDENTRCSFTEFCEPTLGRCVSLDEDPNACLFAPPVGEFNPVEAFTWSGSVDSPTYDQVMMMPVVANLTDDNGDGAIDENDIPDILFTTFAGGAYNDPGILRLISGDDGREHFSSSALAVPFDVRGAGIPAVGDIDEDGFPEIIVQAGTENGIYALEHDGAIKWIATGVPGNAHGGPSVANIDGAGPPEIVTSRNVLSATGDRICDLGASSIVPAIADLDMDGVQEIIVGTAIFNLVDPTATDGTGCAAYSAGLGGWPAVANFDADPRPEIVLAQDGELVMLEHDGTERWRQRLPYDQPRITAIYGDIDCAPVGVCTVSTECGGDPAICYLGSCIAHPICRPGGGPPTIADFDGDGEPEIGIAGRWYYLVYEGDGTPVWAHKTKDFSSAQTGSSVFDFEGDGRAEVVYNDEEFLRVYSGIGSGVDADGDGFNDPEILLEIQNSSGTLMEYPLIVDVDNDGSAEIVVMANNYSTPGSTTTGIRVFKDADNKWVGTRRVWNQHTYHVTNVEEDGTIPLNETPNWTVDYLNNYRQNVQGGNPLNAPNFIPTIDEVDGTQCATSGLVIRFTVQNAGSIGVRAGALDTTVYAGETGGTLDPIETVTNTIPLGPGGSEAFELVWQPPQGLIGKGIDVRVVTDEAADGSARHNECIEDDNATLFPNTLCMVPQ